MKLKDIASTLAVLGSGALFLSGCDKEKPATEVPDAAVPAAEAGEGSCSADDHPADGHCGGDTADAEGEGSCGGEKAEGEAEGEGSCGG
ncbi:MAG: hypothetical protein ACRBN8_20850 [Nannocystales bacterium]